MPIRRLMRLIPIAICLAMLSSAFLNAMGISSIQAIRVKAGWNLLSLPARTSSATRTILFPSAVSGAYGFSASGGYRAMDTLSNGIGFWLKFTAAEVVLFEGSLLLDDTVDVAAGWNIVGGPSVFIPTNAVRTSPPGILASQFFDYVSGVGYRVADTLQPGRGYWVKLSQPGAVILRDPNSEVVGGIVNRNEIGGAGLRLVSCFGQGNTSSGDTLTVRASTAGNQLLCATDNQGNLRALTLCSPEGGSVEVMGLDAHSTAAALIFMTPGIAATDTARFSTILSQVVGVPGFPAFRDFLRQRLVAQPLTQVVLDPRYDSLLTTCLQQYLSVYLAGSPLDGLKITQEEKNHFEVTQGTSGSPIQVDMTNRGWRY